MTNRRWQQAALLTDALLPLAGILLWGWSALAYLLWFVFDTALAAAAVVARALRIGLHDTPVADDDTWVDQLSRLATPVLVLVFYALAMTATIALGFAPILFAAGGTDLLRHIDSSMLLLSIGVSIALQTRASYASVPADAAIRGQTFADAVRAEKQALLPLLLLVATIGPAAVLCALFPAIPLLPLAVIASVLRLRLTWPGAASSVLRAPDGGRRSD